MGKLKTVRVKTGRKPNAKSLANLRPVKKGEVRNPLGAGAQPHNKIKTALRKMTTEQVQEIAAAVVGNNLQNMQAIRDDPDTPVLKVWIASIALQGIRDGNMTSLNMLLDRIIGRSREHIVLTGDNNNPIRVAAQQMTHEERVAELARLRSIRGEVEGDEIEVEITSSSEVKR